MSLFTVTFGEKLLTLALKCAATVVKECPLRTWWKKDNKDSSFIRSLGYLGIKHINHCAQICITITTQYSFGQKFETNKKESVILKKNCQII